MTTPRVRNGYLHFGRNIKTKRKLTRRNLIQIKYGKINVDGSAKIYENIIYAKNIIFWINGKYLESVISVSVIMCDQSRANKNYTNKF